jgi:hypothetical protein
MNKRFRELIRNLDNEIGRYYWTDEEKEKFAELIVRECIDTLDQMPVYYKNENDRQIERDTISDCIRAIEQNFGVKS